MKRCPNCNQYFGDENDYCLQDGTPLIAQGPAPPTAIFPSSAEIPTQYIPRPLTTPPTQTGNSSKWLYLIIGILGATVVVGGFFLLFHRFERDDTDKKPAYETVRTENSAVNAGTPEPKKTAGPVQPPAAPPSIPVRPAVSTARVRFAKGAVTSSVSGSLSDGEVKNYLLACRAGQQLTATLSTSSSCITFADGSTTFRSITKRGDNAIAVTNGCSNRGSYRLDITIL